MSVCDVCNTLLAILLSFCVSACASVALCLLSLHMVHNTRNMPLCGGRVPRAIHVGIDLSFIQRSMLQHAASAIYIL